MFRSLHGRQCSHYHPRQPFPLHCRTFFIMPSILASSSYDNMHMHIKTMSQFEIRWCNYDEIMMRTWWERDAFSDWCPSDITGFWYCEITVQITVRSSWGQNSKNAWYKPSISYVICIRMTMTSPHQHPKLMQQWEIRMTRPWHH